MNDTEVIKAAVGYADGWELKENRIYFIDLFHGDMGVPLSNCPKWMLAALAAQLVEQIDAMPINAYVIAYWMQTTILVDGKIKYETKPRENQGRTMNTLRACVDFYSQEKTL